VDRWIDLGMPGWHPEDLRAVAAVRREARVSLATALQRGSDGALETLQLCSTALDNGVAIPHTSRTGLRIVPHNVVAFVRTVRPIAFGAPAGSLTDILFLVLAADQLAHLVLLARVACLIKFPLMGRALRVAATPGEVLKLVDGAEQWLFDRPPDENR
jgi:mannitol/fructose-specific phosphotransferase system IIA component (Ntr-type)